MKTTQTLTVAALGVATLGLSSCVIEDDGYDVAEVTPAPLVIPGPHLGYPYPYNRSSYRGPRYHHRLHTDFHYNHAYGARVPY